ncbi:hypothetical protein BJV82DRAFT_592649 [Fennellomyces sp. T-0311]|nr:hypothetical protein BJV82DRAFT_592649 [Fennellomyces sp. T-0311]
MSNDETNQDTSNTNERDSGNASDPLHAGYASIEAIINRECNASSENDRLYPVRHPKLPLRPRPRYFINKRGVIYSLCEGELYELSRMKGNHIASHMLYIDDKTNTSFKLADLMAHTFHIEHYDSKMHYIHFKDWDQENCAWDNLVVCDLPTFQRLEIAKLEELHPGRKYTVVRNIHDNLTFERYLISDSGDLYSLIRRRHNRPAKDRTSQVVILASDIPPERTRNVHLKIALHRVVYLSFNGSRDSRGIGHINHCKQDNTLANLKCFTPSEFASRNQGGTPKKNTLRPMLPITNETRWKVIGVLPWSKRSYSRYEVSDLGHVRKIGNSKPLTLFDNNMGHLEVSLKHDTQDAGDSQSPGQSIQQVSRLVAYAFVDGYSETRNMAYHLGEDLHDNRAENLVWKDPRLGRINKNARRVMVTFAGDPIERIEYPSIRSATHALPILIYRYDKIQTSFKEIIEWKGERREALVEIIP